MNRLIRAEAYKFIHSGSSFRVLLLILLALFVFPTVFDMEFMDKTLAESLDNLSMGAQLVNLMMLPAFITICVTFGYAKKTAYYEVMAGSKIRHIIGSKILVEGVFIGLGALLATTGMGIVVAVKNGVGDIEYLFGRALLLCIIYMHIVIVAVLIGMAIKTIVAGMVSYLRFLVIETCVMFFLPLLELKGILNQEQYEILSYCMIINQIGGVFFDGVSRELVLGVLASLVLEVVLWYSIVYYTMKKRLYN